MENEFFECLDLEYLEKNCQLLRILCYGSVFHPHKQFIKAALEKLHRACHLINKAS